MITLGWSRCSTALPMPCHCLDAGAVSLVVAADDKAARARDRMALQCACAAALPEFLPVAPGRAVTAGDALDWTAENASDLLRCLAALAGRVQATLFVEKPEPIPGPRDAIDGAGWLRSRAERAQSHAADASDVTTTVRAALDPDIPLRTRTGPRAILVDLLIERAAAPSILERLSLELSHASVGRRKRRVAMLAAPLPAYGFADIGMPA
ncbi:hypothetical protein OCH239_11830 [Roseivivax halodurans JCM 10272]|uniref:Uncharacterized protein n=1 Tax=Roseivivax halodurans JCM 10272 TaxID=1449350 RepID=X7EIM3_9RHOB|nr:hypothetical protein [Roseivivax halodurans]ETX15944.1 hypothetical protein OCH239_11830 [Roseivivax halodurans JCM 10272]